MRNEGNNKDIKTRENIFHKNNAVSQNQLEKRLVITKNSKVKTFTKPKTRTDKDVAVKNGCELTAIEVNVLKKSENIKDEKN